MEVLEVGESAWCPALARVSVGVQFSAVQSIVLSPIILAAGHLWPHNSQSAQTCNTLTVTDCDH